MPMNERITARADRLCRAVAGDVEWAIEDALSGLRAGDLRDLCRELATRIDNTPGDGDLVNQAATLAARAYGTSTMLVFSDSRRHEVARARQVTFYAAHLMGMTYSAIGRAMNRDHSTVLNGVARVGETPSMRAHGQRIASIMGWSREDGEVG